MTGVQTCALPIYFSFQVTKTLVGSFSFKRKSGDPERGPGSNPAVDAICGMSLLLVPLPCSERFFSAYSSKTKTSKFQVDLKRTETFKQVLKNSQVVRG